MLNYKSKQRILADLVPSVQSVAGTVEAVYDIEDVLLAADTNEIFRSIFGEEETNLSASELHTAIDLVLRRSEN
jgi:hypothetical protein